MNPMPQLEPMLKQLWLSGIMDSLEPRTHQAIEDKLAYTDFLALLIQDEVDRREQRKLTMRCAERGSKSRKPLRASISPSTRRSTGRRPWIWPPAASWTRRPTSSSQALRHGQEPLGAGSGP